MGGSSTVAGIDLTFSAPKSVSVLFAVAVAVAVAGEEISGALVEAHEGVVDEGAQVFGAGGVLDPAWPRRRRAGER